MSVSFTGGSTDARLRHRQFVSRVFATLCRISAWGSLSVLVLLLGSIGWNAVGWLDWQFLSSFDSLNPDRAGILAGIWGSFWMILLTILTCIPIGVGTAIYLEEYATDGWLTKIIKVNLSNLAGVPSIVYGILGYVAFVRMFEMPSKTIRIAGLLHFSLPFGPTVIAGALTMMLLILPVVVIATQEALRSVPNSIRNASFALGASRWQTIRSQVLPAAIPGITTGVILSISRAIGETAPLVVIGAMTSIFYTPGRIENPVDIVRDPSGLLDVPFSNFTSMPIQIYNWVDQVGRDFPHVAAAGIVVLLGVLFLFNGLAVWIRYRAGKNVRW